MARKVETFVVTDEGRDKGKSYILTEMPASQAEKWAIKAFLALARSGTEIPDNVREAGMEGIAVLGFKALGGIRFPEAEALMDEMFSCVQFMPDPGRPNIVRPLVENDVEEVITRVKLRAEVFALHVGFTWPDARSFLTSAPGRTPA